MACFPFRAEAHQSEAPAKRDFYQNLRDARFPDSLVFDLTQFLERHFTDRPYCIAGKDGRARLAREMSALEWPVPQYQVALCEANVELLQMLYLGVGKALAVTNSIEKKKPKGQLAE